MFDKVKIINPLINLVKRNQKKLYSNYNNLHCYNRSCYMKFYGRNSELKELQKLDKISIKRNTMTVITGRRRIGKTRLIKQFCKEKQHLYFFASRKNENLLCNEFVNIIREELKIPVVGSNFTLKDVLQLLFEYSKKRKLIVIIDEFQDIYRYHPDFISELQNMWDANRENGGIHLILSGSIFSLMNKIFIDEKEPLFGRADRILRLQPFKIETVKEIFSESNIIDQKVLFHAFLLTGFMPKYLEILIDENVNSLKKLLTSVIRENSPFLEEGFSVLMGEFGKDYSTYFSILELISKGKTGRSEIESYLQKKIGGYLDRLDQNYDIIDRIKPILAKPNSKRQKYYVKDNFLNFWFRFIYRNRSSVEMNNFDYIKRYIKAHYDVYAGKILERYFHKKLIESGKYNIIGSYWEKKYTNEIDIVAVNQMKKNVLFADVKMKKNKLRIESLKTKAAKIIDQFEEYKIEWKGFCLEDI